MRGANFKQRVCEHYSDLKHDYLYRGDVLEGVPFVSLDAGPISIETPADGRLPFQRPYFTEEAHVGEIQYPVQCVASFERRMGVVMLRTCEANKRHSKHKVFGSVLVAPVRPFTDFPVDKYTNKPFHELVLEGFPSVEDPNGPTEECYRFMVLQPCAEHGLSNGGMICFREMQPVPIRHLLDCHKITRLAIETVAVLDYRFSMFMQQSPDDNEKDAAAIEEDSPIVAAHKKRIEKQREREATKGPQSGL